MSTSLSDGGVVETVPYTEQPPAHRVVEYALGPLSLDSPTVSDGDVVEYSLSSSAIYPDTDREVWVKIPKRARDAERADVVVFQDGALYLDPEGPVRAGTVLDNLVDSGAIPPTIGIFINPGIRRGNAHRKNRNVEYDAFNDDYARFVREEVSPALRPTLATLNVNDRWTICGGSSGGNCAFTAAWLRPEWFSGAISFLASFPQMPGGNPYPVLIPREDRRDVRFFMQTAQHDLNWGCHDDNWFAENLKVAAALDQSGHDLRLVVGQGGHSPNHGGVLLPDALTWMLAPRDRVASG
ncbi:esterase family protein [Microbacterium sp. MPKO10]|uniref:alpha/beta hydrolase n=1 Tax=Microbacterium sp. MPKO10 TaxID=2989818 RepID=UPI002235819F|nr:esterase family protein [Microbacterium sp. MPKO10]MCW4459199.1 esterase family protein [Microbacterium sp. MPKO10]